MNSLTRAPGAISRIRTLNRTQIRQVAQDNAKLVPLHSMGMALRQPNRQVSHLKLKTTGEGVVIRYKKGFALTYKKVPI